MAIGVRVEPELEQQSALIAKHSSKTNWTEQLPDWPDWTA